MTAAPELPEDMVRAAAEALYGWVADDEWPADSIKERAIDCALDVLTAALAGCEVREEWGVRSGFPDDSDDLEYWRGPRSSAEATLQAQEQRGYTTTRSLIHRFIITTPAEEVRT